MQTESDESAAGNLRSRVASRKWYHTIELAPGIVTPGWFDCRSVADSILPASCQGLRCLDIGTFDGFWAFEMERRGASEVVAIDILDDARWDWPAVPSQASKEGIAARKERGEGFEIVRDQLGSLVDRRDLSIYELDPVAHGEFDLVYLGSLLLHLRDPVLALERVRSVCRGHLAVADAVSLPLHLLVRSPVANLDGIGRPYWWKPNGRGLERMVEAAGFHVISGPTFFFMPPGRGIPRVPLTPKLLRMREARELILSGRLGDPHARLLATRAMG